MTKKNGKQSTPLSIVGKHKVNDLFFTFIRDPKNIVKITTSIINPFLL